MPITIPKNLDISSIAGNYDLITYLSRAYRSGSHSIASTVRRHIGHSPLFLIVKIYAHICTLNRKQTTRIFWGRNDRLRHLFPHPAGAPVMRFAEPPLQRWQTLYSSSFSSVPPLPAGPVNTKQSIRAPRTKLFGMAAIHKSSTSPSRYPVKKPHTLRPCVSLPFAFGTAAAWLCAFCAFLRLMFQSLPAGLLY
jgi:hypothetical protein